MTSSADRIEQALTDIQWNLGDCDFNVTEYRMGPNYIVLYYDEGPTLTITVEAS